MATYTKFSSFMEAVGLKKHDLNADTIKAILVTDVPTSTEDVLADITGELATGNGYTNGGEDIQNLYSESGGGGLMTATDVTWTAAGGSIGPFRYVVLYNDTATNDELVGWYDYGSDVTVTVGKTFTLDFGASVMTLI